MIARVATEISADRLFDYAVPDALAPRLLPGQRVRVPFGNRTLDAYVVEIAEGAAAEPAAPDLFSLSGKSDGSDGTRTRRLRPLLAIEDDVPFLSPALIALARWMADYTCSPFEAALRCMVPAAVRNRGVRAKERFYVTPCPGEFALTRRQTELLENLRRVDGGWLHSLTREFACTAQTLRALAAKGAAVIERRAVRRDPLANRRVLPTRPLALMPEQAAALAQILDAVESAQGPVAESGTQGQVLESGARASPPACETPGDCPPAAWPQARAGGDARAPSHCPPAGGGDARAPDSTNAMPPHFPGVIHDEPGAEKYWHSRNYVPHFDCPGLVQFITFRLADSLPSSVIEAWKSELGIVNTASTPPDRNEELFRRIARYEDAGHGACHLKQPEIAQEVMDVLQHGDGAKYRLLAWSVMPNHVHTLIEVREAESVARIVRDWKAVSAHRINQRLGLKGAFWQPEYFDRYVRDPRHFHAVVAYILGNHGIRSGAHAALCGAQGQVAESGTQGQVLESGARASSPACETPGDRPPAARSQVRAGGDARAPSHCPPAGGGDACAPSPAPSPPKPVLLFGVTGSGKTEVYLQAIARALELGRGAIVLVPEIALTPQTVQRFASRFGERIAVLHSALGEGERFDEWHRIRNGEAAVVVGPRSAVFAPVRNLGLIVVDEEHEPSYKQEEVPRYHARDLAVMRGHIEGCPVVLGSATPAMETWRNVAKGKYALARLRARVANRPMPRVQVVDMRIETARTGHAQLFSGPLLEAVRTRLERGEQTILFLNRRGYANALLCPRCGYAAACDACSVTFTYHRADACLRCHICGGWKPVPEACPACGDPAFRYAGFGTQRAETALAACFPQARVLRMDADVTSRRRSHDEILSLFKSGHADILIGTQMIAKGLDFPNVTLVGVLAADMSLHMPDFRAAERTYQLLAQVSGRAGRAELPGEVFIQTYSPDHPAIRAAASDAGFEPFAARELAEREAGGYPPFCRLACLTFRGASEEKVRFSAETFARALAQAGGAAALRVSGVCAAPLAKAKGLYRYQILLRAAAARQLTRPLREVMGRPLLASGVSLAVDVDAVNLM